MARKARTTKKEIRWTSNKIGWAYLPAKFDNKTRDALTCVNADSNFIPMLEDYCGRFLHHEAVENQKPTAGDLQETLDDLARVTDGFIDRLQCLAGHDLEGLIDSAWHAATAHLPDYGELNRLALIFQRQVRVTQMKLPEMIRINGRPNTTDPIKDLIANCRAVMTQSGATDDEIEANYRQVVKTCLYAIDKSNLIDRLRHYL